MLTVKEVAKRLNRDRRTIQRYCERGIFAGVTKSGPFELSGWLIPESEVEKFEQQYLGK